jgi:hypothetical protein
MKENVDNSLTTWSRVLLEKLIITQLVKKFPFTEPKGSLLYSQEPTTGPFPQPDKCSLHPPVLFLSCLVLAFKGLQLCCLCQLFSFALVPLSWHLFIFLLKQILGFSRQLLEIHIFMPSVGNSLK